MNNTVLVTGGSGFIGGTVCRLLADNHTVINVDRVKKEIPNVTLYPFDIDNHQVDGIIKLMQPDTIMHFAADHEVGRSVVEPDVYYYNNVRNTIDLLNSAVRNKVKYFIFSSTSSVYGNADTYPTSETCAANPINPYAKSKHIIEQILSDYEEAYGLKSVSLRYFNAAGAMPDLSHGYTQSPASHLIPILCQNAINHRLTTVNGNSYPTHDGTCARDYTHVVDIAVAHINAMQYLSNGGQSDVFNIGAGQSSTVLDIIQLIKQLFNVDLPYEIGPARQGDPAITCADITKAGNVLNWKPTFSLADIVTHAYNWELLKK